MAVDDRVKQLTEENKLMREEIFTLQVVYLFTCVFVYLFTLVYACLLV